MTFHTDMTHAPITSRDITAASIGTWPAILTLILFFLSNLAVIFPQRVPIPRPLSRACRRVLVSSGVLPALQLSDDDEAAVKTTYVRLDFITVPLASVLLLLAAGVFDGQTVRDGVLGTEGVKPLDIMALFISLAYISISLDATGLLRFLAFWVASKGGASGRTLFAYLYVFFLVCGVVVGNDPVILSGTAFLAYFTRVAGITPPTAWIFSQFAAANMASVVLVSSNPTNLVLSGAFSLSFLTYAAHVALPFLAAALCVFSLLRLALFRSPALVPPRIDVGLTTPAEVRATLVDPRGAVFGSVVLVMTLGVLVGVSTVGVPVWMVTVPPAVVMLAQDVWYDWARRRGRVQERNAFRSGPAGLSSSSALGTSSDGLERYWGDPPLAEDAREGGGDGAVTGPSHEGHALHEMNRLTPASTPASRSASTSASTSAFTSGSTLSAAQPPPLFPNPRQAHSHNEPTTPSPCPRPRPRPASPLSSPPPHPRALLPRLHHLLTTTTSTFPTVTHIAARLPVALLPFALLMFVLVQGLAAQGWVALFACAWAAWVHRTGALGAVGGMGVLSCVLCNFCGRNIGATILLARVLQLWLSSSSSSSSSSSTATSTVDPRTRDGAIYALALGSNFGAFTLTFSASLAGLLWRQILRQKGIRVRGAQFLVLNLPISFVAMLVGCAVLVGQTYVEHPVR
ncbi:hypothetical protein C8Q73DRAFT_710090 [Cubamyces lactineus]|nr:hypothetical protein C8Q73DRAFT_710090 [Cubamyces lactineus]